MPDYDPKSIPILDDIIEDDIANDETAELELSCSEFSDVEKRDNDETAIDNLDLFTGDAIDVEDETMEPSLGTIDQFINPADDDLTAIETDTPESVLIDYHIDQDEPEINVQHEAQQLEDTPDSDETFTGITIEDTAIDPVQPAILNSIVDDVVKQLIPDLEQQLRYLVRQALEEKLPEEIVKQISTDKND